ncbi:ribosomal protein L24 [Nitrosococcus halophilus Nc 4]|uniref:Large ribosomal subunit protein uL24 n=1 Tax=Nitrosococcus halophilus (strain Nc4) TaxID=472759 RepID=D5BVQ5_NITHN|nr:50S ribosomal protein L24 [Nitrosococcus halophilus]ADE15484.1 ribosomal protein L24 [Nitrosococcus halophilus Nc 4]
MRRVRVGDEVVVTAGRSRGKRGKVLRVVGGGDRVIVEEVNMVKRHTRPNPADNKPGGIVEQEAPVHISNVMLYNPVTEKGDRVGFKRLEDGRKVRYFKSNGEVVDA